VSRYELALLTRVKVFLQKFVPLRLGEQEFMDHAVARIVIALLGIRQEVEKAFDGRKLVKFEELSGRALYKQLCGVLAFWINEEELMNKHVKVVKVLTSR